MLPRARILHSLPGRTRLGLPEGKGDQALLDSVVAGLVVVPGVTRATRNPATGTVLVLHTESIATITGRAVAAGLFTLMPPEHVSRANVQQRASEGLGRLSQGLEAVTGGELDLNGVLVVAFTLLAIQQALEGQVVVPAATALWYALNASRSSPPGPPDTGPGQRGEGGVP